MDLSEETIPNISAFLRPFPPGIVSVRYKKSPLTVHKKAVKNDPYSRYM